MTECGELSHKKLLLIGGAFQSLKHLVNGGLKMSLHSLQLLKWAFCTVAHSKAVNHNKNNNNMPPEHVFMWAPQSPE